MNQFPPIERRVAQHYSHRHLEEAILAALAAEDKNLDQVAATGLAAVDHFSYLRQTNSSVSRPTATYSISVTALAAHYKPQEESNDENGR